MSGRGAGAARSAGAFVGAGSGAAGDGGAVSGDRFGAAGEVEGRAGFSGGFPGLGSAGPGAVGVGRVEANPVDEVSPVPGDRRAPGRAEGPVAVPVPDARARAEEDAPGV